MLLDDIYARVAEAPDAIAVQDGERRLSYRELLSRASELAARLSGRGAGPDRVVAVHADRSAELVVGELAVLLAQAAYLPLDPAHPVARTREMLALSGAAIVVTTEALAPGLASSGTDVLTVDLAGQTSGVHQAPPRPGDATLAYVILTSGSTGYPKGVAVTHASLGNLLRWHRKTYPVRPEDRTTLLVSPGFDVTVWDTWPTLAAGGTLVVPPAEVRTSPRELVAWLADERITASFLPTPLAEAVLDEPWPAGTALRTMTTGGSAMQRGVPDGLPFTLVNLYGPAECTVGVTAIPVLPGEPAPPPIGMPIDGVRCYVLDGLDPVPDGEPGEMCLAGECLARGYLDDPAATARSFVPDIAAPGRRMYRTGDKVRRRPDGIFEYLGRLDDQVKIRGFRIEPAEVAAVLRQHPAVRESFVAARRSGGADPRLIGYVAAEATPAELIEFAAARLPSYMVPAAVVVLPALPLTPNGKVDRDMLPAPGRAAAGLAETPAPRRTRAEGWLASCVAALTGASEVGADDDFFALGGTSLLVGRLAARIGAELRVTVSVAELFCARTVAAIAAIIDERSAGDRARDEGDHRGAGSAPGAGHGDAATAPARPPLRRAGRDRPIPLSLPQERVWFFEQVSPGNLAYNFQATVSLRGEVNVGALRAALDEIVRRHEILRTGFAAVNGVAQQHPVARARAPLRVLDVPAGHAGNVIAAALHKPFDLTRPPLARWLLLRHEGGENTLVHVEHHFVHDGWSLAVLLSELSVLYPAFVAGQPSPLPELPVQYADFTLWQRDWMRGEVLRAHVGHWTARLAGAADVLELPADRPRPAAMTLRGAAPRITIPAGLFRALRAFSHEHRVSLFTTMYAGFAALLYRYTGQEDILVGSGAANRALPELEPMLGMVVNTLVLRVNVSAWQHFTDLIGQAQETVLDALAWSDTPVDAVIDAIGPARSPSRTPLFQVMFSFHDSAVPDIDFGGLTGAVTECANGTAKCDLNVIVIPRAQQRVGRAPRPEDYDLSMIWEYSTDLFDEPTMSRMATHYLNLLADAVARPDTEIRRLEICSGEESARLRAWSRGPSVADVRPVTELIAEQIDRAPTAIAVSDPSVSLTYRELGQQAGHLAAVLASLGVGPESVVAVYVSRSARLVVGELAVAMAGAAFLPVDPGYPVRRVSELLTESGAAVLLTTAQLADGLPAFPGSTVLLDRLALPGQADGGPADRPLAARPQAPVHPDSLAYVIYTSGSTGRPKGVQATHGGLANVIGWMKQAYQLAPGDRSTMVASPTFDGSVWEIWLALAVGGTIVVPPDDVRMVPRDLTAWMVAQRITWAFLPTPLAEAVLGEDWPPDAALRFLLTGGDAISRTTPDGLPFTFVNHYGPTETTIIVTETEVPPGGPARPPIGRPLGGARAYVLAGLDPVPVGVPGELYIGGAGVTRGYLGNPAMTAAAFVPDPWNPGNRMYRTGDRARWLPDGRLEFLGRIDDQVKIRGFRIEPGETAATLRLHPEVSDAVVIARPDAAGRLRLVGYVVTTATTADLRDFLAQRLPSYLVPDHLVPLSTLPWTPNGKVDKAALPEPSAEPDTSPEPATTDTERRVAALWQDLLGVPVAGAEDDFFALGGYSLLVGKMLAQVRESFGCSVPLSAFLSAPTVAGLASAIDRPGPAPAAGHPPSVPTTAGRLAEVAETGEPSATIDLDALSDAEAAALLAVLTSEADDA
jgi:amino acid adenylation domain-containing protein